MMGATNRHVVEALWGLPMIPAIGDRLGAFIFMNPRQVRWLDADVLTP
jgi:hypothetical protein